jgi:rhamnopyranosyl-N-acetylglucosaminyl-diphospho-decaprenol beta-1,3/1,4-galactofuranosyltransferase
MKVLTVIVTHNRSALLSRCLDAILHQEESSNDILVINNDSTDDTEQILDEKGIWYITQPNVGSAGGWHLGIKICLEKNYDACWLMDDDGFPHHQALKNLKSSFSSDAACVSSVVLKENDNSSFVFPFPVLTKNYLPKIFGIPRKIYKLEKLRKISPKDCYNFVHLFNGALISMEAVQKIGNVNKDFYLMGDEVDYFFRLREFGAVYSCLNALHFHPDVSKREFNIQKIYYYVKNSIILNSKYFNFILIRNLLVVIAIIGRVARRNGFLYMLSMLLGPKAHYFYKAIFRGLKNRIGHDIES